MSCLDLFDYLLLTLIIGVLGKNFSLCTFNCHGLKSSIQYVLDLCKSHNIIFVNEHWLQHSDFYTISEIFKSNGMSTYLKSSMDPTDRFRGRPFGGVGFVCANLENVSYKLIECVSDRGTKQGGLISPLLFNILP